MHRTREGAVATGCEAAHLKPHVEPRTSTADDHRLLVAKVTADTRYFTRRVRTAASRIG